MCYIKSCLIFAVIIVTTMITGNAHSQNKIDWIHTDTLYYPLGMSIDDDGYIYVLRNTWAQKYDPEGNIEWLVVPERYYESARYECRSTVTNSYGDLYFLLHTPISGLDNYGVRVISYDADGVQRYNVYQDLFTEEDRNAGYRLGMGWIVADDFGNAYVTGYYGCGLYDEACASQATLLIIDPNGGLTEYRTSLMENIYSALGVGVLSEQGHLRVIGNCCPEVLVCTQGEYDTHHYIDGIIFTEAYDGTFGGWTISATQTCWCNGTDRVCDFCNSGYPQKPLVDNQGNLIAFYNYHIFPCSERHYELRKITSTGTIIWSREVTVSDHLPTDLTWDPFGDFFGTSDGYLKKYSGSNGEILWSVLYSGKFVVLNSGNVYTFDAAERVTCYDGSNGDQLCQYDPGTDNFYGSNFYLVADDEENLYVAGQNTASRLVVARYTTEKKLKILDATAEHNPLANTHLWMIKMSNNIPNLTEDTLGQFTTDENGELELTRINCGEYEFEHDLYNGRTSSIIAVGDSLKIARQIYDKPAIKHTDVLDKMYTVHIDNAKFDDVGVITFDTLDNISEQEIILDHTEVRYNLVVRVQWDAQRDYLEAMEDHFRDMSNYLYDVFDGQLRLGTVCIFDASAPETWNEADIKIHADNLQWPETGPCYCGQLPISYWDTRGFASIYMPRWFRGGAEEIDPTEASVRDFSRGDYPYTAYNSDQYRTLAHEFGHYAFGFDEEYLRKPSGSPPCEPLPSGNYGVMDRQLDREGTGPFSSEMSNEYKYESPACQNTHQYLCYFRSCWDVFEDLFERTYYGSGFLDGIWAPIKKPHHDDENERLIPTGDDAYWGPNILQGPDVSLLNYNVGGLIVFPVTPEDPDVDIQDMIVEVYSGLGGLPNIDVTLERKLGGVIIERVPQGKTALNPVPPPAKKGEIIVLGMGPEDDIDACGHAYIATPAKRKAFASTVEKHWFSGTATVSEAAGGLLSMEMTQVDGLYPLIVSGDLSETALTFTLEMQSHLPSVPEVEVSPRNIPETILPMTADENGYNVDIEGDLGSSGFLTVYSEDASQQPFFFEAPYRKMAGAGAQEQLQVSFSDGAVVWLDSTNMSIDEVIILKSSFPIPLEGMSEMSVQVSDAYSVLTYPDITFTGTNTILIYYSEEPLAFSEIELQENDIKIFRWDKSSGGWQVIGGNIDVESNYVIATINGPGVYTVFATDITTDVEDDNHGDVLPYRFELSQNYPNPFNPVTTIEYNLPRKSNVTIEVYNVLGQKIRTLLDREKSAGSYTITWDGKTANCQPAATGVYLYRFRAGDHVETKKMLLLR